MLVLDNARIHETPRIRAQMKVWEQRGLELFFLPPYSPHLNIAEPLWRMLKGRWLEPEDHLSGDALFYAAIQCLDSIGNLPTTSTSTSTILQLTNSSRLLSGIYSIDRFVLLGLTLGGTLLMMYVPGLVGH